jgi:hypothetical protein
MIVARAKDDPVIKGLRERLAAAAAKNGVVREGFHERVVEEGLAGAEIGTALPIYCGAAE